MSKAQSRRGCGSIGGVRDRFGDVDWCRTPERAPTKVPEKVPEKVIASESSGAFFFPP
jgi:hypothetical protein